MGYGHQDTRWLPERHPPYAPVVASPDIIQSALRSIDNHDLGRFAERLGLAGHVYQSLVEACLIFADNDNRYHRWNTSEEPSVYTTSKFASRNENGNA